MGKREGRRRKEENRGVRRRAPGVHAKHSGVEPCARNNMGSQLCQPSGHPRGGSGTCCHFMCLESWPALYPQSLSLPTVEQWCSQQASWLGVLRRSTVSQSALHSHFTFSTSITPYKNDMHKHGLITNGWSWQSN